MCLVLLLPELDKVSQNSVGLHCYCGLRSFFFDKVVCNLLVLERQKLSHALNNIRCKVNFYGQLLCYSSPFLKSSVQKQLRSNLFYVSKHRASDLLEFVGKKNKTSNTHVLSYFVIQCLHCYPIHHINKNAQLLQCQCDVN